MQWKFKWQKQLPLSSLLAVPVILLLAGCEKVIDINLNSAEKKYVIEANLTDQPGSARVMITKTKDFDENNDFEGVSGAVVRIAETGGATTSLTETSPGIYEAPGLQGTSGKTYQLSVDIAGALFTSSSTMPKKINLDTIFVTDELLFTEFEPAVNAVFTDPPESGNSYRFIQYVNNKKEDQLFILNDEYTNGREINSKLFYFDDDDDDNDDDGIKSGDTVRIQLQCIDAPLFKYWFSLSRSSTGGSQQATPANPVTNMLGGALGYFSAHTRQEKQLIVP